MAVTCSLPKVDRAVQDGNGVLGYSVWYEGLVKNRPDGRKETSSAKCGDREVMLKYFNSELIERVGSILEESREESREESLRDFMWCTSSSSNVENNLLIFPDLTILAVDPNFGGRGIRSSSEGPDYLMSSPAAIEVHANQGF